MRIKKIQGKNKALIIIVGFLFICFLFFPFNQIKTFLLVFKMMRLASEIPPPGKMIDVGGFKMHINCMGQGSPTVIFETGNGDNSLVWSNVAPEIAKETRVCTYDRAGLGWSEVDNKPTTFDSIVGNLHTLLVNAKINPPYLMVGHSIGGVYIRKFFQEYPNEVVAMVLVDPSAEKLPIEIGADEAQKFKAATLSPLEAMEETLQEVKSGTPAANISEIDLQTQYPEKDAIANRLLLVTRPQQLETQIREIKNSWTIWEQARKENLTSLGNIPLIILASDNTMTSKDQLPTMETWRVLQQEIANQSIRGSYEVVPGTTHYIHLDKPLVVIQAIMTILDKSH